jgi:hypothetical protein
MARAQSPLSMSIDVGQREGVGVVPGLLAPRGDIGVQLTESSVLHVGITAEAGYDSNVFYENSSPTSSAVAQIIPQLWMTNNARLPNGSVPPLTYSLNAALTYREYLTDEETVRAQRAFNPAVAGVLNLFNGQQVGLSLADSFSRLQDAPYVASTGNLTHNFNLASVELRVAPGGGRIAGTARYTNTWDSFDTQSLKYADNLGHDILGDLSWKWLPKTAIYVQGGPTWIHYYNSSSTRHDSFAYRVLGGIRGLITPKINVVLGAGYGGASYSGTTGGNPSSLVVTAGLGFQATQLTKIVLNYQHGFRNSALVGNFYNVDGATLGLDQALSRLVIGIAGRYEHRRYQGIQAPGRANLFTRNDNVVTAGAHTDFFISRWFYAGLVYALTLNDSDNPAELGGPTGASYVKHQFFGRLGITY